MNFWQRERPSGIGVLIVSHPSLEPSQHQVLHELLDVSNFELDLSFEQILLHGDGEQDLEYFDLLGLQASKHSTLLLLAEQVELLCFPLQISEQTSDEMLDELAFAKQVLAKLCHRRPSTCLRQPESDDELD